MVYEGTWKGREVAIKALKCDNKTWVACLEREAGLLGACAHENILKIHGVCSPWLSLVTEYCSRHSLRAILDKARDGAFDECLTWERRVDMALQAARGMLHLHSQQPVILHRDLKSPNILVTDDWQVKIADLGLAKLEGVDVNGSHSLGPGQNARWLAPEIIPPQQQPFSCASDVYSFGVVMWELLTWEVPYSQYPPRLKFADYAVSRNINSSQQA